MKKNFTVTLKMQPDGDKSIDINIEKLKIIIRPHIFLTIAEVIMYGMP